MKQILVISGKGGTGKTFFTGCLAVAILNKVIVDCDVDAANLHLLLHPSIEQSFEFFGGKKAFIDKEKCTLCGACKEVCQFEAINDDFQVDRFSCEGCTVCSYICPASAIVFNDVLSGYYFISQTEYGKMVHARLGIAQENSGKLVAKLREVAKGIAETTKADFIILDGPPGIGCPVMASMTGVDLAIAITEPTVSGLHDVKRVIDLARHFKVDLKVIINKYDLNPEMSQHMATQLEKEGTEVIGVIPFSEEILESVKAGIPYLKFSQSSLAKKIEQLIYKILEKIT
ncbi:ATP-binding protein [Thermodesulfobacterium commune]|uniref:(4Fe-4S)-binding protein n=3 Tax=Thermodesulfobacterium commune TaxID=1741 RepID=A0A075WZP0_9BACT|nr:ATP-binding protein [Thermodesulfobacterium commune]AIH04142.1 (4Fe-4S)-binding protein [Thermodesulfobacterium commune DSM 2178]KUK38204.1 MAG: Cobyrinic acid ac-diamide synthase [Thermodesulfobacterium commune]HAA83392.1 (4Fe-4S)-binding protein [Thermodesulfobacterium commune]